MVQTTETGRSRVIVDGPGIKKWTVRKEKTGRSKGKKLDGREGEK